MTKSSYDVPWRVGLCGPALVVVLTGALLAGPRVHGEPDLPRAELLVIELFTSQGCSSCPPADRLLRRLAVEGRIGSKELLPLSFHVDYWNHLGWRDPFSSAKWSQRQRSYAEVLPGGRLYTPQVVLNGRIVVGGWDEEGMRAAAETLPPVIPIHFESMELDPLRVAILQPALPSSSVLFVARVVSGFETAVSQGENADHQLRNDHVVMAAQERVLDPAQAGEVLFVELPENETGTSSTIIALARDRDSLAILAAGWRSLANDD